VSLDFAVPLGLLVTELVTNSMKHAFPDGIGTILVSLTPDTAGSVRLIVSDNGVGLPSPNAAKAGKSGLGAGIVRSLVAQLEGAMSVGPAEGFGARTEIRIPLPAQP